MGGFMGSETRSVLINLVKSIQISNPVEHPPVELQIKPPKECFCSDHNLYKIIRVAAVKREIRKGNHNET